jgi:hypothetical protein
MRIASGELSLGHLRVPQGVRVTGACSPEIQPRFAIDEASRVFNIIFAVWFSRPTVLNGFLMLFATHLYYLRLDRL